MPTVTPEMTQLEQIPYPGENSDPFWDQWVEFMSQIDQRLFMRRIMVNLFIGGGGTRTWNGGSGILTWSSDFVVPVYYWGKRVLVRYGPDNLTRAVALQDGQALVVSIPMVMNDDAVVNFAVASQLTPSSLVQWVAGWRIGSALQLKGIGELT